MFTGLVEETGYVTKIVEREGIRRISVSAEAIPKKLRLGDSIAVSGVCLTAVEAASHLFSADLTEETWVRTSFSRISEGTAVNLELPLALDGRIGGHLVQGHVDGVGIFEGLESVPGGQDFSLHVRVPDELEKYLVFKGSVALEGISLTVARLEGNRLTIAVIPHTCAVTNLAILRPGDPVNIETDIVAKYLEKWLRAPDPAPSVTSYAISGTQQSPAHAVERRSETEKKQCETAEKGIPA